MPFELTDLTDQQVAQHAQNALTSDQLHLANIKQLARSLEQMLNNINGELIRRQKAPASINQGSLIAAQMTCGVDEYNDFMEVLEYLSSLAMGIAPTLPPDDIAGATIRFR